MRTFRNWQIKRSGAGLTIKGISGADDTPVSVSGAFVVELRDGKVCAVIDGTVEFVLETN